MLRRPPPGGARPSEARAWILPRISGLARKAATIHMCKKGGGRERGRRKNHSRGASAEGNSGREKRLPRARPRELASSDVLVLHGGLCRAEDGQGRGEGKGRGEGGGKRLLINLEIKRRKSIEEKSEPFNLPP